LAYRTPRGEKFFEQLFNYENFNKWDYSPIEANNFYVNVIKPYIVKGSQKPTPCPLCAKAHVDLNIIEGEVEYIDVTNSIIINKSSEKFLIAGFRLHEMLIVKTNDALLVTKLSNAQEIKQIIKQLKENNKLDWI
jgi:hypothetical protein